MKEAVCLCVLAIQSPIIVNVNVGSELIQCKRLSAHKRN